MKYPTKIDRSMIFFDLNLKHFKCLLVVVQAKKVIPFNYNTNWVNEVIEIRMNICEYLTFFMWLHD